MLQMLRRVRRRRAADGSRLHRAAPGRLKLRDQLSTRLQLQLVRELRSDDHATTRCDYRHRLRHARWGPTSKPSGSGSEAGESGVGYTTLFDASNFPTKISAEVRNWDITDDGEDPDDLEVPRPAHRLRRRRRQAGGGRRRDLDDQRIDPTRFGVYLGSGEGQQDFQRFTPDDGRRARRRHSSTWPSSPQRAWNCSIPSASWNRSRTCRPATWPACSTPRGRTSTA